MGCIRKSSRGRPTLTLFFLVIACHRAVRRIFPLVEFFWITSVSVQAIESTVGAACQTNVPSLVLESASIWFVASDSSSQLPIVTVIPARSTVVDQKLDFTCASMATQEVDNDKVQSQPVLTAVTDAASLNPNLVCHTSSEPKSMYLRAQNGPPRWQLRQHR